MRGAGDPSSRIRGAMRLYRWLLLVYPPAFRRAYGEEMVEAFGDSLQARIRRHGTAGRILHWGRTVRDLALNVPAEWVRWVGRAGAASRRALASRTPGGEPSAPTLDIARYEVVHAARALLRAPALALTVVGTLAVGIGVVTAFFSLVNAILLRPLPYAEPEELVRVQEAGGRPTRMGRVSVEALAALRDGARSLEPPALFRAVQLNLGAGEWTESVRGARVGPDLLPLLGVRPALGRLPGPADTFTGAETVVVLGHDLWRRRFSGDPGVLGRSVTVEGQPARIVGVMPPDFGFPEFGEIWAPFTEPRAELLAPGQQVEVVGRLAEGVPFETADLEIRALGTALAAAGDLPTEARLFLDEGLYVRSRGFGVLPWILLGAGTAVLLVVCSNVASLLLARGARRRGEMAVRSSLGASRVRLVARTLLEGSLLATVGGGLGLVLSEGILRAFLNHLGANLPLWFDPAMDLRVVGFALLASVGSVLAFGLPPALAGTRTDLRATLSSGAATMSGDRTSHRVRGALIAAEVALAFLLVTGGAVMAASVSRMGDLDLGVDGDVVHEAGLHLTATPAAAPEARRTFVRAVRDRLGGLPDVALAGSEGTFLGFSHDQARSREAILTGELRAEGGTAMPWGELEARVVSPGYFSTVGLEVLRGRDLRPSDVEGGPLAAVASASLARRLWPSEDAVGRVVALGGPGGPVVRVVGVVEDRRELTSGRGGLRLRSRPRLYLPDTQAYARNPRIVVRPRPGSRDALATTIRGVVHQIDSRQAVQSVRPLNASAEDLRNGFRTVAALMVALALAGSGLAVLGIWGVIGQAVAERTREIGIRTAVGGSSGRIVARIMAGGARVTFFGLVVGLASALLLTRVLTSVLYRVDPLDPGILAGIAALFALVGLTATYLPARRAAAVDPVRALRSE